VSMAMTNGGYFDEASKIGNYWTDTIYPNAFNKRSGKVFQHRLRRRWRNDNRIPSSLSVAEQGEVDR
jgi:hypothetical protein